MYPKEINDIPERFFRQAYETLYDNIKVVDNKDTMNAFNKNINKSGISPTLTTRLEGFKTAILVVEKNDSNI